MFIALGISLTFDNDFNLELCDFSPCLHGKCVMKNSKDFQCDCYSGYNGTLCQNGKGYANDYRMIDEYDKYNLKNNTTYYTVLVKFALAMQRVFVIIIA